MTDAVTWNRATLLAGSALALAWATPTAAQTQDVPVGTAAAGGRGETVLDPEPQETADIVVTGTRLARDPNEVAPSPISTVTAADFRSTGQIDVSETLREVPALSNSISIGDSLERDAATNLGVASLDLRGLGVDRTLVVVNGRRHVAGVPGSQAVDISTIPNVLIDRVEVLTGGASAVYGADAVTGVVNFVLKRDFEGLDLNVTQGISDEGDGRQFTLDAAIGKNFDEGRGNVTLAASYSTSDEVQYGDRPYTANNARSNSGLTYANPALRFQRGDITGATPNFASFYTVDNGLYPFGFRVPLPGTDDYDAIFTGGRTPTAAEQALIDRARNSPSLAFQAFPAFAISSTSGLIARDDYQGFLLDVNRNGVQDCNESFIGATTVPNFFGGCYVSNPDGTVRLFEDGIIASGSNQFGGDGAAERFSAQSLLPKNMRVNVNLLTQYEYSDALTLFAEGKYVRSETRSQNPYNTFYDSLYIAPDNP